MNNTLAWAVALIVALTGCTRAGSEFEGKWIDTKRADRYVEIVRGDSGVVLHMTAPDAFTGRPATSSLPGVVSGGVLQLGDPEANMHVVYDKATDHLKAGGAEYRRVD